MTLDDLVKLNESVELLLMQNKIAEMIQDLKQAIRHTKESFVWSSLELNSVRGKLPERIKSAWIFVLKENIGSGSHYHPNSIQHMVMIEGKGASEIAGVSKSMIRFGSPDYPLDEIWDVIGEGIAHEFFPEDREMVVISFHTCEANELEEVSCQTGESRLYEG